MFYLLTCIHIYGHICVFIFVCVCVYNAQTGMPSQGVDGPFIYGQVSKELN